MAPFHSYIDLDKPRDTAATKPYNSNTGLKRVGRDHAFAGFGEHRVSKNSDYGRRTSRPAYSLEDKDTLAWAAALEELNNDRVRKAPRIPTPSPWGKENRPAAHHSSYFSSKSSSKSQSTTPGSQSKSTTSLKASNPLDPKRKREGEEPTELGHSSKKHAGHPACKRRSKSEEDVDIKDVEMCYCDDPLHTLSDE